MISIQVGTAPDGIDWAQTGDRRVTTRNGAVFKLCRELVRDGVADQPWQAMRGDRVDYAGGSIYRAACLTITAEDDLKIWAPHPTHGTPMPTLDAVREVMRAEREAQRVRKRVAV